MRRLVLFTVLISLLLLTVACGKKAAPSPAASPSTSPSPATSLTKPAGAAPTPVGAATPEKTLLALLSAFQKEDLGKIQGLYTSEAWKVGCMGGAGYRNMFKVADYKIRGVSIAVFSKTDTEARLGLRYELQTVVRGIASEWQRCGSDFELKKVGDKWLISAGVLLPGPTAGASPTPTTPTATPSPSPVSPTAAPGAPPAEEVVNFIKQFLKAIQQEDPDLVKKFYAKPLRLSYEIVKGEIKPRYEHYFEQFDYGFSNIQVSKAWVAKQAGATLTKEKWIAFPDVSFHYKVFEKGELVKEGDFTANLGVGYPIEGGWKIVGGYTPYFLPFIQP